MITVGIMNEKGGVGKTTTAINLAAGLSQAGRRVLLLDLDAQASATIFCRAKPVRTMMEVVRDFPDALTLPDAIVPTEYGFDLVPASEALGGLEAELMRPEKSDLGVLAELLEGVEERYDYAVLDGGPNASRINLVGLATCDCVLVPVRLSFLDIAGLTRFKRGLIDRVTRRANPRLRWWILPTVVDTRTRQQRELLEELRGAMGDQVLPGVITQRIAYQESMNFGQPIYAYAPRLAHEYQAVVEHILSSGASHA